MKNNFTFSKMIFSMVLVLLSLFLKAQKPIIYGQSIVDTIKFSSDLKTFTISLAQNDIVFIRVSPLIGSSVRPRIKVWESGNVFAEEFTTKATVALDLVKRVQKSGIYTIVVSDYTTSIGLFCISVERFNTPPDAILLNCNTTQNSALDCESTIKAFKYLVEENSLSQIRVAPNLGEGLRPKVWICNPDGSIIKLDSTLAAATPVAIIDTFIHPTQCFYVLVVDVFGNKKGGFSITHGLLTGTCAAVNIQASPSRNSYCTGDNIILTANSPLTNATYSWTGPKNFKSNNYKININNAMPGQSGTYKVTVDDPSNCSSIDSISIVINNRPTVSPSVDPVEASVCAGDSIKLNVNTNALIPKYIWYGPNESSSTMQSPIIIVPDTSKSGRWDYLVTVTDDSTTCSSSNTISVQVNEKPKANITSPINDVICKGETLLLNVATDTSVHSFSWTGPKSFSSTSQNPNIPNVDQSNQGNYIVTVTDTNGCQRKDTINVSIEEIVLQAISSKDSIIASAKGGGRPYTYTLIPGGQTDTTGIFTNLKSGLYTIHVSDNNNCSDSITINLIIGAVEPYAEWGLSIFPNPSHGQFQFIRNENNRKDLHLSVFDGYGKKLTSLKMEGYSKTMDLSYLQDGVYLIRVSDGDKVGTTRVVILK